MASSGWSTCAYSSSAPRHAPATLPRPLPFRPRSVRTDALSTIYIPDSPIAGTAPSGNLPVAPRADRVFDPVTLSTRSTSGLPGSRARRCLIDAAALRETAVGPLAAVDLADPTAPRRRFPTARSNGARRAVTPSAKCSPVRSAGRLLPVALLVRPPCWDDMRPRHGLGGGHGGSRLRGRRHRSSAQLDRSGSWMERRHLTCVGWLRVQQYAS